MSRTQRRDLPAPGGFEYGWHRTRWGWRRQLTEKVEAEDLGQSLGMP